MPCDDLSNWSTGTYSLQEHHGQTAVCPKESRESPGSGAVPGHEPGDQNRLGSRRYHSHREEDQRGVGSVPVGDVAVGGIAGGVVPHIRPVGDTALGYSRLADGAEEVVGDTLRSPGREEAEGCTGPVPDLNSHSLLAGGVVAAGHPTEEEEVGGVVPHHRGRSLVQDIRTTLVKISR